MQALPITALTALAMGTLLIALTLRVVQFRRRGKVVLGDGGDREVEKAIRAHGNASEQIPIALIVLGLAEWHGAPGLLLALAALAFVGGRLSHGLYFARHGTHWKFRVYGMWATVYSQGALLLLLLFALLT